MLCHLQAGNVNASIGSVPYTPGSDSGATPLTPQILASAASACNTSCLCDAFSVGVPLNSPIIRNRWQAFIFSSLSGTPRQAGDKCAYVKATDTECRECGVQSFLPESEQEVQTQGRVAWPTTHKGKQTSARLYVPCFLLTVTDDEVFNATADGKRIRLSISSPFGVVCAQGAACPAINCLASVRGNLGVLSGADCLTSPAAMFTAVGDGKGAVSLVAQESGR